MRIVIHNLNIIAQEGTKIQYGGTGLGRIGSPLQYDPCCPLWKWSRTI